MAPIQREWARSCEPTEMGMQRPLAGFTRKVPLQLRQMIERGLR